MRVVVTGVAGLLGSHVAERLLLEGHEVVGLDNLTGGYRENVPDGVDLRVLDGRDREAVLPAMKGADVVFHAACTAHEGLSVFSPHTITSNTFGLTASVASAAVASGVGRFVQCSSMARYGTQDKTPFHEEQTPRPQDPYAIAKVAAENLLRNMSSVHGVDVVIAVPHNIYGPRQVYNDPYRNVAAIMINRILHGQPPVVYGDGTQIRCFSHISDAVNPVMQLIESDGYSGQVFNIGPDSGEVTILELAEKISSIMGWTGGVKFFPDRPQEVRHATCSADKARRELNYEAKMPLDEGLADLVEWISCQPRRAFDYALPIEIDSALVPETWSKKLM